MTSETGETAQRPKVRPRWQIALEGNAHRGVNRALSMENLYGLADPLTFRTEAEAQDVVDALTTAGHPCHIAQFGGTSQP